MIRLPTYSTGVTGCAQLPRLAPNHARQAPQRRSLTVVAGLGDRLLDYIEGGPKLRRWYGQGERPTDGGGMQRGSEPSPQVDQDAPRDSVLVTDADSPTGDAVVLQLILAGAKIRVLVRNAQQAVTGYGSYVTPITGDVGNQAAVAEALKGARAVIVTGKLGPHLLPLATAAGVEHIVLPSLAGGQQGAFAFLGPDAALSDAKQEAEVADCGIPHTIVRAGKLVDTPGGDSQLRFGAASRIGESVGGTNGSLSREDLARVLAGVLDCAPSDGLALTVVSDGPGRPPDDWREALSSLQSA